MDCWVLCRAITHRQIHRRGSFGCIDCICNPDRGYWLLRDFSSDPLFDFPQTHHFHIPVNDVISYSAVDDCNIFNFWCLSCFMGCLCMYPPQFQYHLILFFVSQSFILYSLFFFYLLFMLLLSLSCFACSIIWIFFRSISILSRTKLDQDTPMAICYTDLISANNSKLWIRHFV